MQEAKKLGDYLVVVVNNDNWFEVKGKPVFMHDKERKEIIEALGCVDKVIISYHKKGTKDISVYNEIKKIKPNIFANGGDRSPNKTDLPSLEYQICKELNIKMVFNVGRGGKIRSSSELLKAYSKNVK
jgi:glycerol-3-phosphate cytidylyltransferase-like family protein